MGLAVPCRMRVLHRAEAAQAKQAIKRDSDCRDSAFSPAGTITRAALAARSHALQRSAQPRRTYEYRSLSSWWSAGAVSRRRTWSGGTPVPLERRNIVGRQVGE